MPTLLRQAFSWLGIFYKPPVIKNITDKRGELNKLGAKPWGTNGGNQITFLDVQMLAPVAKNYNVSKVWWPWPRKTMMIRTRIMTNDHRSLNKPLKYVAPCGQNWNVSKVSSFKVAAKPSQVLLRSPHSEYTFLSGWNLKSQSLESEKVTRYKNVKRKYIVAIELAETTVLRVRCEKSRTRRKMYECKNSWQMSQQKHGHPDNTWSLLVNESAALDLWLS